jgi:SPP1 gp7 family putative phage head morphogenesis protein
MEYATDLAAKVYEFSQRQRDMNAILDNLNDLAAELPSLGDALAEPMLWAALAGVSDEGAQSPATVPSPGQPRRRASIAAAARFVGAETESPFDDPLPFNLPPREAIDWMQRKRVLSPQEFARLDAAAKARSFSVSGLTNEYTLNGIKTRLQTALEAGETQNTWLSGVEDMLDSLGVGSRAGLPTHHLRLIYNQNIAQAYGAGRLLQMRRSIRTRPYWEYHTVGDEAVRPEHAALNGVVRPADDPFWNRYYPPWDFGCRCWVTSVSQAEMDEESLSLTTDEEIAERYKQAAGGSIRPNPDHAGWPPPRPGFGNPAEAFAEWLAPVD